MESVDIFFSIYLSGGDRDNFNMRGAILHVMISMLSSITAILAAIIILTTGYYLADQMLSVIVGALIVISAYPLIRNSSGRA